MIERAGAVGRRAVRYITGGGAAATVVSAWVVAGDVTYRCMSGAR